MGCLPMHKVHNTPLINLIRYTAYRRFDQAGMFSPIDKIIAGKISHVSNITRSRARKLHCTQLYIRVRIYKIHLCNAFVRHIIYAFTQCINLMHQHNAFTIHHSIFAAKINLFYESYFQNAATFSCRDQNSRKKISKR